MPFGLNWSHQLAAPPLTRSHAGGWWLAPTAFSMDAVGLHPGLVPISLSLVATLLSTYYVPGIVPSVLPQLLTRTLRSRHNYPHTTDEETEAQGGIVPAKATVDKDTAGI